MMNEQLHADAQAVINFACKQCDCDMVRAINALKAALHRMCIEMPDGERLVARLDATWADMQDEARERNRGAS